MPIYSIVHRDVAFNAILRPEAPTIVRASLEDGPRRFNQRPAVNTMNARFVGIVDQLTVPVREIGSVEIDTVRMDVVDGVHAVDLVGVLGGPGAAVGGILVSWKRTAIKENCKLTCPGMLWLCC